DPDLGKVVLYQLSYFRIGSANIDRKVISARGKVKYPDKVILPIPKRLSKHLFRMILNNIV
ncbi:MAG: hypothetical protein AAGC65_24235, partial [Mucilaginibacter sp.]|uniref:hypothetical protein n=1 Tax=Mucilaginibacter sp. TaxID=1882438 RepID=UPI0031B35BC8